MNSKFKRLLMALLGVIMTSISIAIFQRASLGTDPFTSFITGICNIFGISFGVFYSIICACVLIFVFIVDKSYIGIATIFNLLGSGFIVDIARGYLVVLVPNQTYIVRISLLIIAVVLMCFSASLYFTANLGVSAYDAISIIMSDKKIASFKKCRITTDSICVIVGFTLKASIGIGTIITALFMGPLIQWFNTHISEPLLYDKEFSYFF